MSERALGREVDALVRAGDCLVTESDVTATILNLSFQRLRALHQLCADAALPSTITDEEAQPWALNEIDQALEPFRLSIQKPVVANTNVLLTETALDNWLDQGRASPNWHVATLELPFETLSSRFAPWGTAPYQPQHPTKSPRELVREYTVERIVPSDANMWLLTSNTLEIPDHVPDSWLRRSVIALARSIVDEIDVQDRSLVLRGPPRRKFDPATLETHVFLGADGYRGLQAAAAWVYEDRGQAEIRHGLLTDALARAAVARAEPGAVMRASIQDAFSSAKIAYQLSLSGLGKEAVKAMSDLRKAVSEDTSKTADTTRQVVTSVAAASAVEIGLIAAKLGSPINRALIYILAIAGAVYVGGVTLSGWHFLSGQKALRSAWKRKLYQFVPDGDYSELVTTPAAAAERAFWFAAVSGGILILLLLLLAFTI